MDKPILTAEQEEEQERQKAVSYEFLRRHLDIRQNADNAKLLGDFITAHKLPWTMETLEMAYESVKGEIQHGETVYAPPKEEPKWANLTKAGVRAMSLSEYRSNLKDKDFLAALGRLGIKEK